jgi:hypothetical protein
MFYIIQSKETLKYLSIENIYSLPEWFSEIEEAKHFKSIDEARTAVNTYRTSEPLLLLSVANGVVLGVETY